MAAWNYDHCLKAWGVPPERYGVRHGQRRFLMQQYVSDGQGGTKLRVCVWEASRREFAVRDMHAQPHSQSGPRVHIDPKSEGGKAYMHDPDG
eukprot:6811408-Karenia_brevis.AAC.1